MLEKESILWVDKYNPKKIEDIVSNKKNIDRIVRWFEEFENDEHKENGILVSGSAGIGKSSSIRVIGEQLGYNVMEFNASDTRSKKKVKDVIYFINNFKSVSSFVFKDKQKTMVIMDEIDGMSAGDRGGLNELSLILKSKPKIPIISICNKRKSKNINELSKQCLDIKFDNPNDEDMFNLSKKILKKEKKEIPDSIIRKLVVKCNNDIRQMIHVLYEVSNNKENIDDIIDVFKTKDINISLYDATKNILIKPLSIDNIIENYNVDKTSVALMLHENYNEYIDKYELDRLNNITDYLSYSDILGKKIYKKQIAYMYELHGMLSSLSINYYINNNKIKKEDIKAIEFTSVLKRKSTSTAKKNIYMTLRKKIPNLDLYPSHSLEYIKLYIIKCIDNDEINKLAEFVEQYKLTHKDLEMICKYMDLGNDISKKYINSVLRTKLKNIINYN